MRLTIRWKLILGIGLPVLAVYGLILALDYRALRAAALEQTQREAARVADLYAARLDGTLDRVAQVARSAAAVVAANPMLTESEIQRQLAANIAQDPEIFGSCLAFEPGAYARARERFAPYAYRAGEEIAHKDIAASYDYTQPQWEWYARPRETLSDGWTEPYFDEGGGNIVMCTFSAPVIRDGTFIAVMTVDLDVTRLQATIDRSELQGAEFVIVSRQGLYISHPEPARVLKGSVRQDAITNGRPDLVALADSMVSGHRGAGAFPSPGRPGESELIFYSPIRAAGWSFVAVSDLRSAMEDVLARLGERGAVLGGGLLAIFAVISVMGTMITRPVRPLMTGVRALAGGDLDATVQGVHRRDELGELAETFNAMTARLREHVHALGEARAAREAADSELRVARDIQTSLLPKVFPPSAESGFDLFAVCRPAKAVGGDFYDFLFVRPDELFFLIADVSGKGVPAALYMAVARTLIRGLARDGHGPAEILSRANEILVSESDSGGMFLTAFVGTYKPGSGQVRYACAGHPPPLRLLKGAQPSEIGESLDVVLGILPGTPYQEREGELAIGERLVLFTDGVTEARSPGGDFFGAERTASLVGATAHLAPESACAECVRVLEEFEGGDQADDITIMILERRA